MKDFFKVTDLPRVMEYISGFSVAETETVSITEAWGRVLAEDIVSDADLPGFSRSTMDGFAVRASSTFGASEQIPAFLTVAGAVGMGEIPNFSIGPGEAARIPTGGMLPAGTDGVVMIEHAEVVDDTAIEIYKSVAPGMHVIEKGEDFKKSETVLARGTRLRAQETGLLAAFGRHRATVYKKPVVGIVSTGDEVVPVGETPGPGKIRDINAHTLSGMVVEAGGVPKMMGIVRDDYDALLETCSKTLEQSDMVLISGGSSVGSRDFTIDVFSALPGSEILVHGIPISPGKPTILAKAGEKALWGLPGHVVSAMVVFQTVVRPFVEHAAGISGKKRIRIPARLDRNISSAQGRLDYVRVTLAEKNGELFATPILGKSGLINTMVKADGLIEVGMNTEGMDKGEMVWVVVV